MIYCQHLSEKQLETVSRFYKKQKRTRFVYKTKQKFGNVNFKNFENFGIFRVLIFPTKLFIFRKSNLQIHPKLQPKFAQSFVN